MSASANAPSASSAPFASSLRPCGPGRIVLATDLDGTFLGGSDEERRRLYDLIAAHRDAFTLVFVTGRDLPFIRSLESQGVPVPDLVVGDVGTTVVDGRTHEPVAAVESWIDSVWQDAGATIEKRLAGEPGIRLQEGVGGRRVSYFYDDDMRPDLPDRIRSLGFDCIVSAGIYLDVLPRGISKGPTLVRLVDTLGIPPGAVVTAGDTLNDLSLLRTPFAGIAMGNSEPALVEAIRSLPNVHRASAEGAGGILEGLVHHGKLSYAAARAS